MATSVSDVHWLNWLDTAAVIQMGTVIVAGDITCVSYDTNTGVFELTIGGKQFRLVGTDQITIGTPAQAAPVLYGVPLGS